MTEWIITCNINVYNVEGAFDKLDTIDWKQSTYVEKGDIVYIYVGAPMSAIRYKCEAMEVELPEATIDDSEFVLDGTKIMVVICAYIYWTNMIIRCWDAVNLLRMD